MSRFEKTPRDPTLREPLPDAPLELVQRWMDEARDADVQPRPESMTLATVDPDGGPSARIVLCRGFDIERGYLVFYTNLESCKAQALAVNPRAALVFHWDALQRQVRVEGPVTESPEEESDAYFASRPRLSQIAAWASDQSRPVRSRSELLERLEATEARFPPEADEPMPRPPFWGGYRVWLERVELWAASEGRAHDRVLWKRDLERDGEGGFVGGFWKRVRLQP